MITKSLCLLLLIGFVAVECKPFFSYYNQINVNNFIDVALEAITTVLKPTIDPFHPPDHTFEFHKKIIIKWHGSAHLSDGTVTGLSHIKRTGDCVVSTDGGRLDARLQLGDNNIHVHYKVVAKFMGIQYTMSLDSTVRNLDVKTSFGIGADGKLQVSTVDVDELKHVNIDIKGHNKPVNHLIAFLSEGFVRLFNPSIRRSLAGLLKDTLNQELKKLKFPPNV